VATVLKTVKKRAGSKPSAKRYKMKADGFMVREERVGYGRPGNRSMKSLGKPASVLAVVKPGIKYHIIISIDRKKWQVVPENRTSSIRNFTSKPAAIAFVKKMGKPVEQIIVHSELGEVEKRI
jgi:hypothetical protein